MNFKIIYITISIFISLLSSKTILREQNDARTIIKKEFSQNRNNESIIEIDFESNTDDWYQDSSNGWQLTTESYSSPTYSYNSPDDNNSGELTTHSLYSEQITLPNLVDGEILQYSFSLNCNMPDFSQEDNPFTPGVDESLYLADYYIVSVRDVNESAWHISDYNSILNNGNNWWCGNEEDNGYLDNWYQYLDTPEITIGTNAILTADMKWAIEDFNNVNVAGTCADGWDQANVQISIDNGMTWTVIEGDDPYDFQCGYGSLSNGFDGMPGWGDIQDWHNVSFDLSNYANQTIKIRFAFYSDVGWSVGDDASLTGLQIDNIEISDEDTQYFFNDADNNSGINAMTTSGSSWVDQLYDYCDTDRPGYLSWDTYNAGDAFDGNTLMDLSSFAGKNIQFRFQTLYDGNHYNNQVENAQGNGLYIDDINIYKKSTFNPIAPSGVTGYLNSNNVYILWNDLNVSGTGDFIYDNGIFSPDHFIVLDEIQNQDAWAGTEIYTAGTSIVDSIYIYVFGAFDGKIAGFSSFGSNYNVEPDYEDELSILLLNENFELDLSEHAWVGIDVNNWTFYGSFIIAQSLSENYAVGYDPTSIPSSQSKIFLGNNWSNWADIVPTLNDPLISDGEWGIRAKLNYSSPEVTYNIYRDGILIDSGLENFEYQDDTVESGNTYTYNISALYPNGDESPLSESFTITISECDIAESGCSCDTCNSGNCIYDCGLNCIDFYNSEGQLFYLPYINNNNCDDGEDGEYDLTCNEFLNDGLDCIVDLDIDNNNIPNAFSLGQNIPNPFNPYTTIPFSVAQLSNVELKIFNALGQEIYKKSFSNLSPGNYTHQWDAKHMNSGVYIYTLRTNSGIYLKEKMLLIK